MGRPPLNLTPVPVRLSKETLERIKAVTAGKNGRPQFIRDAVEEKLASLEAELTRRERERG